MHTEHKQLSLSANTVRKEVLDIWYVEEHKVKFHLGYF